MDGWRPRHFGRLGDDPLAGLGALFQIWLVLGAFPTGASGVRVALITAKRRPIGLFRSVVRLFARAGIHRVQAWEADRAMQPFFNTGPGRMTTDSVWRGLVRTRLAEHHRRRAAEVNLDFRRCYEHMACVLLARAVLRRGYPVVDLRCANATCRVARRISGGIPASLAIFVSGHMPRSSLSCW